MAKETEHGTGPRPMYISQDGFEKVPLLRGFDLIRPLWGIINRVKSETGKDCFICGGYARFCASPRREPVKAGDIDVYGEDETVFSALDAALIGVGFEMRHENDVSKTYEHQKEGVFSHLPTI